jgi:hypothetical protein
VSRSRRRQRDAAFRGRNEYRFEHCLVRHLQHAHFMRAQFALFALFAAFTAVVGLGCAPASDGEAGEASAVGSGGAGGSLSAPDKASARAALLAQSRAAWAALKASNGADYRYMQTRTVYPFGGTFETIVEVRADQVVRRSYGDKGSPPTWVETGAALGSHTEPRQAPPITLDELYARCQSDILSMDEGRYTLTVSLHPSGVINLCQAWPRGCQDDCALGYEVSAYEFLD